MERAGRLNNEAGGGSMTFLGIADTLQGDLTGYIPSNLISICDGIVYMNSSLFGEGMRPAVDFNLSISIVGGRSQLPILRALSGSLRRDYLQYVEVARLSKLQSGLSKEAEQVMKRGQALVGVMQQAQYKPVELAEEVLLLYALKTGLLDDLDAAELKAFQLNIGGFSKTHDTALLKDIEESKSLNSAMERRLSDALKAFFEKGLAG
jgi:F-type H+-transporting ATPase subunit alpha